MNISYSGDIYPDIGCFINHGGWVFVEIDKNGIRRCKYIGIGSYTGFDTNYDGRLNVIGVDDIC